MNEKSEKGREVMAEALYMASKAACNPYSWADCTYGKAVYRNIDAVIASDPLRARLGSRAIEAIMAGDAAVVPLWKGSDFGQPPCKGYVRIDIEKSWGISVERLDKPSEDA